MHNANSPFVRSLDSLSAWRRALDRQLGVLSRFLQDSELHDEGDLVNLATLQQRLRADRLVVAVVAEFSRGKSELLNAIFFSDVGRRVLPATPGRTTMCPVELAYDADEPVRLSLLPIETRLQGLTLSEMRRREDAWAHVPLHPHDPNRLAQTLAEVTRTRRVSLESARALGFWNDERPQDNPARDAEGQVEVPAWRHALINYPHPLLKRGMVVIDTPGLNAVGAEPELTLSLLPSAHATIFLLAADTGVTRSDLTIWREHLSGSMVERFVVLNKIDTLEDPLSPNEEVNAQIELQRQVTAHALGIPATRVYPLSARNGLSSRISGHGAALVKSRLPQFEEALSAELLPRQRELLSQAAMLAITSMKGHAQARLADQRRALADQMHELSGLRGKSGTKVKMLLQRVAADAAEFERSGSKLNAMRSVHLRMLRAAMEEISVERLRLEVEAFGQAAQNGLAILNARRALGELRERLHKQMERVRNQLEEIEQMLAASYQQLNAEFAFVFAMVGRPTMERFDDEIDLVIKHYDHYLSPTQAWRLAGAKYLDQLQRNLLSKLRIVFDNATSEVEVWAKACSSQVDQQLRDRRTAFSRRRESLERIQSASGDLETRIQEVQTLDEHLAERAERLEWLSAQCSDLALGSAGDATEAANSAPGVLAPLPAAGVQGAAVPANG